MGDCGTTVHRHWQIHVIIDDLSLSLRLMACTGSVSAPAGGPRGPGGVDSLVPRWPQVDHDAHCGGAARRVLKATALSRALAASCASVDAQRSVGVVTGTVGCRAGRAH